MKKFFFTITIILTIFINIVFIMFINKNLLEEVLYDKTIVAFNNPEATKSVYDDSFYKKIIAFSNSKDIEISQYSYLTGGKVDIYSTKTENYDKILILPNLIFDSKLNIHNFENVYDVGFKGLLYIDTKNHETIHSFLIDFDDYGALLENTETTENQSFWNIIRVYIDKDFIYIVILFLFIFVTIILLYFLNNQRKFLIHELWGYTTFQLYNVLTKTLYIPLFIAISFSIFIIIPISYIFKISSLLIRILPILIFLNVILTILLFIFSVILFSLCFPRIAKNNINYRFRKIRIISFCIKLVSILLIISLCKNLTIEKELLDKKLEGLESWKKTENLYTIGLTQITDDLYLEDKSNDKILKTYKDLSNLDKVFIIDSLNFQRSNNLNSDNEEVNFDYNYKFNVRNNEDLYYPYGRRIIVDDNYLKRNTVKSSLDNKNIINKINYDKNVLNILVPEKLEKYEDNLKREYREWFYFQKIEVSNIYREASNETPIQQETYQLNVNLLYVKNNQSYFTYNTSSGDNLNNIKDPIVIVYTENVDNSILASTLGNFIFIESDNEYGALKQLTNITKKYNAYEINAIKSIYDQKGVEINNIENTINRLILNIIIIILVLIILMIVITFVYYKAYITNIIIKSLHGYSFIATYKKLLFINIFLYVNSILTMSLFYNKLSNYIIIPIVILAILDFIVTKGVSVVLLKKGELKFIKGEFK